MSDIKELSYKELSNRCDPGMFKFNDTSELEPLKDIIGQERAVKALEFGIKVKTRGYNLYLSGMTGTGKTSFVENYIQKLADGLKVPDDWCYVYNFEKPNQPVAINLPAGTGKVFQKDMDEFIKVFKLEITKAFTSEDYEREKANIAKEFQDKRNELLERLDKDVEEQGFRVKTSNAGIYFQPVVGGKTLSVDEFDQLEDEVKQEINKKSELVQLQTLEIIRRIRNVDRDAQEKISEWENKIALFAVGMHINDLKEKYEAFDKVKHYLETLQDDILSNLEDFTEEESADEQQALISLLSKRSGSPVDKYKVNLLVDNSELNGVPLIVDFNPTYYSLVGKLEYENEFGTMTTDFSMIKGGLFHFANGGYLILQAKDVLNNIQSWEAMKRALKTRQICIDNLREQMGHVAVSTIKPEPIPLDVKVVLVGSEYIYQTLYAYDEDFKKLFKIKVDFDEEMDRNEENILKMARFINSFCSKEYALHFDRSGVAAVIDHASRLVEDQFKLSSRLNDIAETLSESCTWAELENSGIVSERHVKKAIEEKRSRSDKYDKKLLELLEEGTIMIDTEGEVAGQINGLSVLNMGDYAFGKPSRITATTYMGKSGIVNIEREIEMSGTSHSKGVLILCGYIGQKYAQEIPLSLSASLCFEQLYSGVDGDSASSAELYCILSSLSELPIKQGIAVTGSVNQRGEIQPIGGATMKIEGFFELCRKRGLNGKQGVIIPWQNCKNLVLHDDVVQAVKDGLFHIYPVKSIDEGIEILTGVEAGVRLKDGSYREDTANYLVYEKLKKFAVTVAGFGNSRKRKTSSDKKQ